MPPPSGYASVKLVLRVSNKRTDGTAPVHIRVTANRKSRFKATGVYVLPREWNDTKQQVRASHELAPTLNEKLQTLLNEARTIALHTPSADAVKAALGGTQGSLTAFFERFIGDLDARAQYWEARKYRVTLGKLQACLGQVINWGEVNRATLVRFERYLREPKDGRPGNGPNTTQKEMTRLRRVYKQAIREGTIPPAEDPFLLYEKPGGQRVHRRKLSLEEVLALARIDETAGLVRGTLEERARDAFVFAFYAGGIRFSDVACLKAADISAGRVAYRMMKTGTLMSIPLPPAAQQIASKYASDAQTRGGYLFPILSAGDERDGVHLRRRISSRNAQFNEALKRVAVKAGLAPDGLSTHVARHSFADYARRASGDVFAISKMLGHGNLATTETYLRTFDLDAVDHLAGQIWK